ncbi:Ferredoxin--NADP reductase [Planctomycetes bacterium Poly30]|uniref:ferredoxin--NADP(+) reductase n=1 Tax=Saltatorellus ferox TaxID=2528018 RepID=A0A518ES05_9BACT|nr:Ferredoxin--NADP reductase [Planctomycetes bacterium Poly30]
MKIFGPNATITARREWTDGLATFTVRPDGWTLPDFEPGQFANLSLPEGEYWDEESGHAIRRAYSIASTPGLGVLDFYIRRVDDGQLTPRIFQRSAGDRIYMDERIAGHFTLEGAQDAEDLVLVGTGTGVAPYRPMLLDAKHRARFGRTILFYSDRYLKDLGYLDELQRMADEDDSFLFFPTLTGDVAESEWSGLRGRVQKHLAPAAYEALTGKPLTKERCQVFLCGNPKMVATVQEDLEALGMARHRKREPGQIHMEKYW